jgi:predicted amidohydrolase
MKISVIQPDIIWEDKTANYKILSGLIEPLFGVTDIVVLPEMFNTGFSMNPSVLGELPEGDTFHWMKNLASNGNFGLCGSYIVIEHGMYFNRWVFISPDGESLHYNKRHLFSMGGEDTLFTQGSTRLVFSFRGMKISPYICYDLRFPVWSRNTDSFDLMIYSANWPLSRQNVWNTLLKARAIENQCFVAGSNRTGIDGAGIKYSGESMIINPRGEIIVSAGTKTNHLITSELSLSELSDFRKKFPVSNDADDFTLNIK